MHAHDYYGDRFKWFVGVVKELSADGTKARVRVFGIHRMDDTTDVSDGDLPLAIVLTPPTGGGSLTLTNGDWVMGFFADGDDCQQPVIIGVLGGGAYSDATSSAMGWGDNGGDGNPGDPGSLTDSTVKGSAIADQAYNFLRSQWEKIHGDSTKAHHQTCGMMGHLYVETIYWKGIHLWNKKEGAFGICQWRFGRRDKLFTMAGSRYPSLTQQLSYIFHELHYSSFAGAYNALMAAQNTDQAVFAFSRFELHAGVSPKSGSVNIAKANARASFATRRKYAQWCDSHYKNLYQPPENSGSTSVAPTAPQSPVI